MSESIELDQQIANLESSYHRTPTPEHALALAEAWNRRARSETTLAGILTIIEDKIQPLYESWKSPELRFQLARAYLTATQKEPNHEEGIRFAEKSIGSLLERHHDSDVAAVLAAAYFYSVTVKSKGEASSSSLLNDSESALQRLLETYRDPRIADFLSMVLFAQCYAEHDFENILELVRRKFYPLISKYPTSTVVLEYAKTLANAANLILDCRGSLEFVERNLRPLVLS